MNPMPNLPPQLIQIAQTLGINPALLGTPQGVQILQLALSLAQQAQGGMAGAPGAPQAAAPVGPPAGAGPLRSGPPAGIPPMLPPGPPMTGRQEMARTDPYAAFG